MGNKSDDGAAVPVWFGWFLAAGLAGCAVSLLVQRLLSVGLFPELLEW
tara:strand:- start:275 stop:418 length:144 start_codon:yes stop_codon:yes gene_type:complete